MVKAHAKKVGGAEPPKLGCPLPLAPPASLPGAHLRDYICPYGLCLAWGAPLTPRREAEVRVRRYFSNCKTMNVIVENAQPLLYSAFNIAAVYV